MSASFKDLLVWQRALQLAKEVYKTTTLFPDRERYGLQSQMCRAAVSIASNIAEGQKRGTRKDFAQFLRIAYGSSAELETQILIAQDAYPSIDFSKTIQLLSEVQKMLPILIKRLHTSNN